MPLATHFASQISKEFHLSSASSHVISPQLPSFLLSSILSYPCVATVSSTVRASYPKWNLRNGTINFITHVTIYWNICDFFVSFNTVSLAVIKILLSSLVAAKEFKR
jgi:hypothetical protein